MSSFLNIRANKVVVVVVVKYWWIERKKKLHPLWSSPFPNPLSRVIFEGEITFKCYVASEIIALNSEQEYIHAKCN